MQHIIQEFAKHRIRVLTAHSAEELYAHLDRLLAKEDVIGSGDSVTLEQLGVFQYLRSRSYRFLDKFEPGLTSEDKRKLYLQCFQSDVFISGVNAVTRNGHLYFIDGNGSRIAPIIYGPSRVILVAGHNKIADSDEAARQRVRNIAAPLDAARLGKRTPCAAAGKCFDCQSPDRICNDFLCITGQFDPHRMTLILVDGSYGY